MLAIGVLLLMAPPGFAEETDPVPGLKDAIKEQTGIDLSSCPQEQAARFLEKNYQPYCGNTEPGFILFNEKTGLLLIGMDMSFVDCDSMSHLYPGYSDGALLPGVDGVSIPETVMTANPDLPAQLGYRGTVSIRFQSVIDRTGVPIHTCILEAEPPIIEYLAAAMAALKQWRYMPAMKDGQPVKVLWASQFSFELF